MKKSNNNSFEIAFVFTLNILLGACIPLIIYGLVAWTNNDADTTTEQIIERLHNRIDALTDGNAMVMEYYKKCMDGK